MIQKSGICRFRRWTCLPRWLSCKEFTCNARDTGSIPGWGRSLQEQMATHSGTLAWRIPRTEEPGRRESRGVAKCQTRPRKHTHYCQDEGHADFAWRSLQSPTEPILLWSLPSTWDRRQSPDYTTQIRLNHQRLHHDVGSVSNQSITLKRTVRMLWEGMDAWVGRGHQENRNRTGRVCRYTRGDNLHWGVPVSRCPHSSPGTCTLGLKQQEIQVLIGRVQLNSCFSYSWTKQFQK